MPVSDQLFRDNCFLLGNVILQIGADGQIPIDLIEARALLTNGSTQTFIAKRYKTTEANLHHWIKQRGLAKTKI